MGRSDKIKPVKKRKCPICERIFVDKAHLVDHIGKAHKEQIPEGWSAARYECYLRTDKTEGKCIYCGKPTDFNESTGKYHRICTSEECRKKCATIAKSRMVGKYGKVHLLNDPEMQRKMVYSRKNSGTYVFQDDHSSKKYEVMYDSSYGRDFLSMLDNFLGMSGRDIMGPSPHTYFYMYQGKKHFYIPDFYIASLGLEIEIKDGEDNPNMHPKIQAVDKVKEQLKDEVMESLGDQIRYLKIVNKDYTPFFAMLSKLKEQDVVYLPKWDDPETKVVEPISEGFEELVDCLPDKVTPPLLKQAVQLYDPVTNYKELLDEVEREIRKIKTPEQYIRMDEKLIRLDDHLAKVANKQEYGDHRMAIEARKARKRIAKSLRPLLQKKYEKFEKLSKMNQALRDQKNIITESIAVREDWNGEDIDLDSVRIPVYVVLTQTGTIANFVISKYTKDPFNHASISLDESLREMFSFSMSGRNGFVIESIYDGFLGQHRDTVKYTMYAYFAKPSEFFNFQEVIDNFKKNADKFKYSTLGLLGFLTGNKKLRTGKMFCSEFVAHVLSVVNPDIIKKQRNEYDPYDLAKIKGLYHICHGTFARYDSNKVTKIVQEKLAKDGYQLWKLQK